MLAKFTPHRAGEKLASLGSPVGGTGDGKGDV